MNTIGSVVTAVQGIFHKPGGPQRVPVCAAVAVATADSGTGEGMESVAAEELVNEGEKSVVGQRLPFQGTSPG